MAKQKVILLVEDDEGHATLVIKAFRGNEDRYKLARAVSLEEAGEYLSKNTPDIILADLFLPDGKGIELLQPKSSEPQFPLVIMTSHGDEQIAVEAMKAGALDYVVKSGDTLLAMPRIVDRGLREWGLIIKQKQAEEQLKRLNEELINVNKELTLANKKLEQLANFDALTGVANRRSFMKIYEDEWKRAERNKLCLSLIMIDVDFFKAYNDNYGHQAGDECLQKIATLLKSELSRPGDFLARYGGEEFVVILPGIPLEGTAAVAEKLRKTVEVAHIPHVISTISEYVTISLGTATTTPSNKKKPSSLIAAADETLYKAKRSGRNRVEIS
jgi:two-component system chemotaxis family response regulator WspR